MAGRQSTLRQSKTFAAGAAIALLVALYASPALASSNASTICNDVADASLEIAPGELLAKNVSQNIDTNGVEITESASEMETLSPTHYLAPRVEAVLRKVFEDSATPLADSEQPDEDDAPTMKSRLPGVSDDELSRYKRQMYRTDI
ncbi:MAG: hypothetical protein ACR2QI_10410 [Woeseiaceae bacterium]